MNLIRKYFPDLAKTQVEAFELLGSLVRHWNAKINLVSRKDIDHLYLHHVLHSLAIARFISFKDGTRVMDFGTGGGFPGIPLAIMFPDAEFHLVDSTGKKIKAVKAIVKALGIENAFGIHARAEEVDDCFDFIAVRAVKDMSQMVEWCAGKIEAVQRNETDNGLLALKGGAVADELAKFPNARVIEISEIFEEEFFETKKLIHLPLEG
ncbi:MAG: 16S rRNA (guanine(527)-N(7))-methyltransferase RsmG [Planctomycetota bacterium]|jgi:16S rRNA (guanine527-N7)-methyltransferase|nr:16S rRNA (guanine(527)-N(7))-methyltransferase RsmG [Planctomycetota bacterium]MDP6504553.1 16S rRNA (guanine(527)-N(7))-methyltransferase RsmG [Planctomycetota bacterium]